MHQHHHCGPWQRHPQTGCRYRLCSRGAAEDAASEEPEPEPEPKAETTPALPERTQPPASEYVVMTERRNVAAKRLIESVFNKGEDACS